MKSPVEMGPLKKEMIWQVSPELTLTNLLQLPTIPGCVGCGVEMPFQGCAFAPA